MSKVSVGKVEVTVNLWLKSRDPQPKQYEASLSMPLFPLAIIHGSRVM